MELVTLLGFAGVVVTVLVGILLTASGEFSAFLSFVNLPSLFITLGGSSMAMISMHYVQNLKVFRPLFLSVLRKNEVIDSKRAIVMLISFSEKARREGLLALEDDIEEMDNPFFKKALQLVIDGTDPEVVKQILVDEINSIVTRHSENRKMFEDLADLSPAFGLVGTLIGLIFALGSIGGDITVLAQGMSTALLTTLYGSLLANGLWTPVANKLARKTRDEIFQKEILLEGVLGIQFGDNPRILQQKLLSYFPEKGRAALEEVR